jgi:hypothetical protein
VDPRQPRVEALAQPSIVCLVPVDALSDTQCRGQVELRWKESLCGRLTMNSRRTPTTTTGIGADNLKTAKVFRLTIASRRARRCRVLPVHALQLREATHEPGPPTHVPPRWPLASATTPGRLRRWSRSWVRLARVDDGKVKAAKRRVLWLRRGDRYWSPRFESRIHATSCANRRSSPDTGVIRVTWRPLRPRRDEMPWPVSRSRAPTGYCRKWL